MGADPKIWDEWLELIAYRNGLIHARASRPESSSITEEEKPVPSKSTLDQLNAGWATGVVIKLIGGLHNVVGTSTPKWLVQPCHDA
jgi:hypothetical protein